MTEEPSAEARSQRGGPARDFAVRVLARQVVLGVGATLLVMSLAPWMLMLGSQALGVLWSRFAAVGTVGAIASALLGLPLLRRARRVVDALAMEPERLGPHDVGLVADVPLALTLRFVAAFGGASALLATPLVLGDKLDGARSASLALLTFATFSATAIVHFVVVRAETLRAIELGPFDAISAWLEHESVRTRPGRRIVRKMLLAIVVPVGLVGIGSVLVAHAHLRAAAEQHRATLATQVARLALEPVGSESIPRGREEAIEAAAAFGILVRAEAGPTSRVDGEPARLPSGNLELHRTLEGVTREHAVARYRSELTEDAPTGTGTVALVAVLLAAIAGGLLGRALAGDLRLATRQVASLSTEAVLRGEAQVGGAARFALVAEVGDSVAALTDRFRDFAAAQQRALQATAAAQRFKQLLFASVSHDLKSPLNAILGFCELLRSEPLTVAQEESLDMIEGRGRELYAMIETILDAARVEAGQLKLAPEPMPARELVDRALTKAFDLLGERQVEIVIELAQDMPDLRADPQRGASALAVLLAHAMSEATLAKQGVVRIRATREGAKLPRIDIEHASPRTRPSHLEHQLEGRSPTLVARGAALRLSLARAIIELHGGRVEVSRGARGEAVVTSRWPAAT
ncbi:MAG: HAMP domain-containing histidine kinase [Deltaproteobacteria bacterium]|nr:HAMP domain-containing histidine kinase [Deltaproteobacteria bacterium]